MKHEPPWKACWVANHWEVVTDRELESDEYDINEDPDLETVRLEAAAPDLLAACEANLEFQAGTHSSIDEIMELAEKCKRLTAAAINKAKGT